MNKDQQINRNNLMILELLKKKSSQSLFTKLIKIYTLFHDE